MKRVRNIFFAMLLFQLLWSNNVQVNNVRLTSQNTADDFTMVEFDITWENSWRYSGGPGNWDAAWIFVKYRVGVAGQWQHAWLNNSGHTMCGDASMSNGLLNPGQPFHNTTNPSLGIFLFRSAPGTGTFSCNDVQLRWNYGANTIGDQDQVDIKVFAIEMVYIPQGSFYVGSGGAEIGALYEYPSTNVAYHITSEAAITVGTMPGNLYYSNSMGFPGDQMGPIPAAFPKGFKAFYAMKYEISQQGYLEFLNTLTRVQQINRVESDISGSNITNPWVMSEATAVTNRSNIRCQSIVPSPPGIVNFFCDANLNGIAGEFDDGQNVACNYISYSDMAAYLDWSALRLMSELEFEKCGRGSATPVPNEYAWGNHNAIGHTALLDINTLNEVPADLLANMVTTTSNGPLRVGTFARVSSDRVTAGAGYYGCMELSSNLHERGVTIGTASGRAFTGNHGDGLLSVSGGQNVIAWPTGIASIFIRGGSYIDTFESARLSNRESSASGNPSRERYLGGRGVRTE